MLISLVEWMKMQAGIVEWLTMCGEWGIVIVILYEGKIALSQDRTSKIFEMLKHLEDPIIRESRRVLYQRVRVKTAPDKWWEHDDELDEAAATICARYALVAVIIGNDRRVWKFIAREWANNICWTHETLEKYLLYRRIDEPNAYYGYTKLYEAAKPHRSVSRSN